MPQPKGGVGAIPWKHHAFCLTHEATFADVARTIQLFISHHKTCVSEQEYTEFSLAYSQLLNFPEELYKLTWLQKLALNYHRIATVSESIDKLHNLQYLNLDHNRLSSLPNAVSNLVHLKVLSVSFNKLKFLCPLGKLMSLETLNLQTNKLVYLPTEIAQLANLKELNVKDNPLISPPVAVAQKGLAEIVSFLNDLETGVRPYTKMKMMILGEVGAGKTHLAQWLRNRKGGKKQAKKHTTSSEAHELFTWEFEGMVEVVPFRPKTKQPISVQVWDFDTPATKDLTRPLHAFLMTPRTVYLVVWNLHADPKALALTYWLESIASKFPQSSVVIAATHYDMVEGREDKKEEIREVTAAFSEKYQCISRICLVSCATGSGLERLREMLEEVCASQLFLREKVPASFFGLEDAIAEERRSRNPPVMLWQEYVSLATICNVAGSLNLYKAAQLFNDTGVIIHLMTRNVTPPVVVLDHNWLFDFITQLTFTNNVPYKNSGLLTGRELQHVVALPGVIELYWGMLDLLQTVEVIFPLVHRTADVTHQDGIIYFLPRWLPETTPLIRHIWRATDPEVPHNYDRIYVLNIIPDGIFGKILARINNDISMDPFVKLENWWRNAAIASHEASDSIAFIELSGNELTLEIRGFQPPVVFFQALIDIIESVLTYRLSPLITRYVTCTECISRGNPNPNRLLLHTCELAFLDHHPTVECTPAIGSTHMCALPSLIPEIALSNISQRFEAGAMEPLEELGSGAYGVVYKARVIQSSEVVALKRLENTFKEGSTMQDVTTRSAEKLNMFLEFWHEASILTKLKHECITGLRGVCFEPLSMALEYIAGPSLYNFCMDRSRPISWKLVLRIARDLARALQYMHSQEPPIVHRDLKSPNVLLLSTDPDADAPHTIVKLLDFGTAAVWERVVDQPTWQAPEILAQLPYWEACDVYSYGIILWEIVCRAHPFDEFSYSLWMSMLEDEIIRGLRPTLPPPTHLNRDFANLIRSCWRQDPTLRPTFDDVLQALDRLTFLEDLSPPVPIALLQKKDKISVDERARRHSQSISKASVRRGIQNKSYSSPPVAPKTSAKNLRNSATLAALFGEDGVFGERPRAQTMPIPMPIPTTPPAHNPPPNLIAALSQATSVSPRSNPSTPPSSANNSLDRVGSMTSVGSFQVMGGSYGSSMESSGSTDSIYSQGLTSSASVDSSHLLVNKGVKVIDANSLKSGSSLGSHAGKRVTYAINPIASKSSVNFRPHLTVDTSGSNNNNSNDEKKGVVKANTPPTLTTPTTPTTVPSSNSTTPDSNKTNDEPDTEENTTEDEAPVEEVEDLHIRDDREIHMATLPPSPYRTPRKVRAGTDSDPPLNAATDLVARLINRSASDATGLVMRNRAFSDADATHSSKTGSDSDDSADEVVADADADADTKVRVARQRAFSDADMFVDPSLLIHIDSSTYSGSNSSLNRSMKMLNKSSGSIVRKMSRSSSVPEGQNSGGVGRSDSPNSFLRQSLDSSFGDLTASEYDFDFPEPQFGIMLSSDPWEHGVGKGVRKWAKVGSAATHVKAATLARLLEMMTRGLTKLEMNYASQVVPSPWTPDVGLFSSGDSFIENFLLAYRLFTDPSAIFDLLMISGPPPTAMPYQIQYYNQHQNTIILGVANFMKKFLEDLQQDELKARNFRLYGKIQRFLQGDFAVMQPHSAKHMIQILVNRRDKVAAQQKDVRLLHPTSMTGLEAQDDLSMERGRSVSVDLSPQIGSPLRRPTLYDFYDTTPPPAPRLDRANTLDFIRSPEALQNTSSLDLSLSSKEELSERYQELITLMRNPTSGVPIKDRKYKTKMYTKCFMGSEAVDWLVKTQQIPRDVALRTMQQIYTMRVIHNIGEENQFIDGSYFYTFMDDNMELMAHQYTILDISRLARISPSELLYALSQQPSSPPPPVPSPRTAPSSFFHPPTSLIPPLSLTGSPPPSRQDVPAPSLSRPSSPPPSQSSQYFNDGPLSPSVQLHKLEKVRELCPNLVSYLEWCTKMTLGVSTQIVKQKEARIRAEVIDKFILIASYFMQLNNFNGVIMVLNSILSEPIMKLSATWKKVPTKSIDTLNDMCKAVMGDGHMKWLRKSMDEFCSIRVPQSTDTTCSVPYFGVLIADLAQIHHEHPTFLENGFLNVQKISKIGRKMKQLQIFQRRLRNYSLTPVNWIQDAITNTTSLTEHQIGRLANLHVQEQGEGDAGAATGGLRNPDSPTLALTERDWALLFGSASALRFLKAHCVLAEGEFSTRLYRVKSGRLKMEKKDVNGFNVRSGTVEVNGMFGEFSLLGANTEHRFVVDTSEAELWAVDIAHVSALFAVQTKLRAKFFRIFAVNLANKIASFPPTPSLTLENIGNSANLHLYYNLDVGSPKEGKEVSDGEKGRPKMPKVDHEFRQDFQLGDEYVIKEYNCHIKRSGKLYLTQNHMCFSSRFYGLKTKKKYKLTEINALEASANFYNQILFTKSKKVYKVTFQKQTERDEALEIMKGLWLLARKGAVGYGPLRKEPTSPNLIKSSELDKGTGNTSIVIEALRERIKSQGALTDNDWKVLGKEGAKRRVFGKNDIIVEEGDQLYRIFQLTKGKCRIEKKLENDVKVSVSVVVGYVEPNATFGEVNFLIYGSASSSVVGDSDKVEVYMMERQYVNILYELNPELAGKWFKYLASALQRALYTREKQLYFNDH